MSLDAFLFKVKASPETLELTGPMAVIESHYDFTPTSFRGGTVVNAA